MKRFDLSRLRSAGTARTYPLETKNLRDVIETAIGKLPRWSLIHSSEQEIQAIHRSMGLEDDVTVRLIPVGSGGVSENTRAEFESASRIGVWDLGRNGRNLRRLLAAIDQELAVNN